MISFSKRLKYFREALGYSQKQIAQFLNIDRSTYAYYETGKTHPDLKTLGKICKIFSVEYNDLLSEDISEDAFCDFVIKNNENKKKSFIQKSNLSIHDLTHSEKELIAYYRLMDSNKKTALLSNISKENK